MNTILTDDDRETIFQQCVDADEEVVDRYGRAIEAAVLAKLREQEPVAEVVAFLSTDRSGRKYLCFAPKDDEVSQPLYAAPLPAVVQVPRDLPSARDYAERGTMAVTADWMAGWDAARKYVNTAAALAPRASTMSRWIERWHGSGPDRGWSIWEMTTSTHGDRVAYVGEGEHSERLTALIVQKHNESLAAAPEPPAQGDPLEKLTRIQEELGLYNDKPAQTSVPAPWREAMKVAREALQCNLAYGLQSCDDWVRDKADAALAQLDALEGGE